MSTSPLRATSEVFDESVLKVEFLPLPTQIPDYALNLNTESLYYRLQMIMQEIFGPIRVQGFNVHHVGSDMVVDAGLILHKNYIVRLLAPQSFTLVAAPKVVYATITETLLTAITDPDIINVNPPLSHVSLPGPNQYRFTIALGYADAVPGDTTGVTHFKICDVAADGTVTNLLPLYTKKIGAYDLAAMETEQADHDIRLAVIESAVVGNNVVASTESMAVGDFFKMIDSSGAKAKKLTCSLFENVIDHGFDPVNDRRAGQTVRLSATQVATVWEGAYGNTLYLMVGTNVSGTMVYSSPVNICLHGEGVINFAIGALDSTHIALVLNQNNDNNTYTRVLTLVDGGASVLMSSTRLIGPTGAYGYVASVAVLDSTHYVPVCGIYTGGNSYLRACVATFASDVTLGAFYDKLAANLAGIRIGGEGSVGLDSGSFFSIFQEPTTTVWNGIVGTVAGDVITWGNATQVTGWAVASSFGLGSVVRLSATKVAVGQATYSTYMYCEVATIATRTITWKTQSYPSATSNNASYRTSLAPIDATHFAIAYWDTPNARVSIVVATLDGSDNLTYGGRYSISADTTGVPFTIGICALSSTDLLLTYFDGLSVLTGRLASVSGTVVTLGNSTELQSAVPTLTAYATLDTTHIVSASVISTTKIYCRLFTLTGSLLGLTHTVSFAASGASRPTIAVLSPSSFVVMYQIGFALKCRICTISGGIITLGAEYTVNTGSVSASGSLHIVALTSTKVLAVYGAFNDGSLLGRVATIVGTVPTFGTEVTVRTFSTPTAPVWVGQIALAVHGSGNATVLIAEYDPDSVPDDYWITSVAIAVSGTVVTPSATPVVVLEKNPTPITMGTELIQIGNFIVFGWAEWPLGESSTWGCNIGTLKVDSTFRVVPADTERIWSPDYYTGLVALGGNRFGHVYTSDIGMTIAIYRLTDGGTMIRETVPMVYASGSSSALSRSVGLSPSCAVLGVSENRITYFVDDREDAVGVMQQVAAPGETKLASLLGDLSAAHTGLTIGARYGLSTALALVKDELPFMGVAIASNLLRLKGVS